MSKVVYWMTVSLDGFVETRDGKIDWSAPSEELFRYHTEDARRAGAFLYGRRTYELMEAFWPTADQDPSVPERLGFTPESVADFASAWRRSALVVDEPRATRAQNVDSVGPGAKLERRAGCQRDND